MWQGPPSGGVYSRVTQNEPSTGSTAGLSAAWRGGNVCCKSSARSILGCYSACQFLTPEPGEGWPDALLASDSKRVGGGCWQWRLLGGSGGSISSRVRPSGRSQSASRREDRRARVRGCSRQSGAGARARTRTTRGTHLYQMFHTIRDAFSLPQKSSEF